MTINEAVTIGEMPIEIIRKSNLKNLYVRINPPDGTVVVSTPMGIPEDSIKQFVLRKMPEIIRVRERMIAQERQAKREYVSGESCYLWGKAYMLQVVFEGSRYKIEKTPNKIIMKAPVRATEENREKTMTEWYRSELKRVFPPILIRLEEKIGVEISACNIKNMRTRWGSCNVDKKRILINLQLVKKPVECLEYVLTHELVHLIEKNHTKRFHSLVEQYYPNWRDAKRLLSEMPLDNFEQGDGTGE